MAKWKRSEAGGWNNVEVDLFVWCPCDVNNEFSTLMFYTLETGASKSTATCPHCGRVFRAVVSVRIEEQEATNG